MLAETFWTGLIPYSSSFFEFNYCNFYCFSSYIASFSDMVFCFGAFLQKHFTMITMRIVKTNTPPTTIKRIYHQINAVDVVGLTLGLSGLGPGLGGAYVGVGGAGLLC